jgi:hypothetical protein
MLVALLSSLGNKLDRPTFVWCAPYPVSLPTARKKTPGPHKLILRIRRSIRHPCWTKKQYERGEDEACVQRSTSDFDMRLAPPRLRPFPRVSPSSPLAHVAACIIGMLASYAARKTCPGGGCLYDASHHVLVLFAQQIRHFQSQLELAYRRVVPTRVIHGPI